jgi:hypothetical protein
MLNSRLDAPTAARENASRRGRQIRWSGVVSRRVIYWSGTRPLQRRAQLPWRAIREEGGTESLARISTRLQAD